MYEIVKYKVEYREVWDEFISKAKNSSFLFNRDYLEYHSDRFEEFSFLFFKKNKLVAVIPGNVKDKVFYSHQYLTFGGLITSPEVRLKDVMKIFDFLNGELKRLGIQEVIYKPPPYIYHNIPAQEDLYVLFRLNAMRIECNISSSVYMSNRIKLDNSRKNGLRKSVKLDIEIVESNDYRTFWEILTCNLRIKHGVKPVHTIDEILFLKSKFPGNIKLFLASREGRVVAGTVVFQTKRVAHVQYISASDEGKSTGALDLLFQELLNSTFFSVPVFDFGKSTEQMGTFLNEKLIFQKEGFGARGVVYEVYKYQL